MKQMGERSAGNPHAAFDVEGTGDVARHRPKPARQSSTLPMSGVWKRSQGRTSEAPPDERGGNRYVRPTATAPHSDSTESRRLPRGVSAARDAGPLSAPYPPAGPDMPLDEAGCRRSTLDI